MKAPPAASYRAGEVEAQKGFNAVYISWEIGGIMTTDEMPQAIRIAMEHFAKGERVDLGLARSTTIGGQEATQVEGKSGSVRMAYAQVRCGKRGITLTVVATSSFETIRDRMFGSFRCAPIAKEEEALGDLVPIAADDPDVLAGWRYLDDDREILSITNDELVAIFVEMSATDAGTTAELRKLVPKLFAAGGAVFEPTPGGAETRTVADGTKRSYDRGELVADDERSPAVTTLWTCEDRTRMVLGLVIVPDPDGLAGAVDWLSRLRCSRTGENVTFAPPPS